MDQLHDLGHGESAGSYDRPVGGRADPKARALVLAALRLPAHYKVVEWLDPAGGRASRTGLQFPKLDQASAFVCAGERCSAPVSRPEGVFKAIRALGFATTFE